MIIPLIADPHSEKGTVKVVNHIRTEYPTGCTLSLGDHTKYSPNLPEFRWMYDLYKTIYVKTVKGNHDIRSMGNFVYPESQAMKKKWDDTLGKFEPNTRVRDGLRYERLDDHTVFIAINSNDSRSLFARGFVSPELCHDLKALLDDLEGNVRIVGLHHRPYKTTYLMELENADLLLKAVKGRCEALVYGHRHKLDKRIVDGMFVLGSHKTTTPMQEDTDNLCLNVIETSMSGIKHWIDVI